MSLVHTETLKIVANVLEKDIPLLRAGMKAKIRIESYPEKVFEGRVEKINSALDLSTRTLQAEIYIPNPRPISLKPGMFCKCGSGPLGKASDAGHPERSDPGSRK